MLLLNKEITFVVINRYNEQARPKKIFKRTQ